MRFIAAFVFTLCVFYQFLMIVNACKCCHSCHCGSCCGCGCGGCACGCPYGGRTLIVNTHSPRHHSASLVGIPVLAGGCGCGNNWGSGCVCYD